MNREEILKKLRSFKNINSTKYGLSSLGLFGSFAREENSPSSDIDLFVKIDTPNPFIIVHMKDDLESIFNMNVDIVRLRENMNPFLKKRIENEGIYV